MVIGCVLRIAESSIIWNYADPLTSLEQLYHYLTLAMSSGRFSILCHSTQWHHYANEKKIQESYDVLLTQKNFLYLMF